MSLELGAFIFSFISILTSLLVARETVFKPAKMEAVMEHWTMWLFSSYKGDRPTGNVVNIKVTPNLTIRNFGARPVIIKDIRIECIVEGAVVHLYPSDYVSEKVVEIPNQNEKKRGLGQHSSFGGVMLAGKEAWRNAYAFTANRDVFQHLIGDIDVSVQIRTKGKVWKEVAKNQFSFGSHPYHLRSLNDMGPGAVAGTQISRVYSKEWEEAREKEKPGITPKVDRS